MASSPQAIDQALHHARQSLQRMIQQGREAHLGLAHRELQTLLLTLAEVYLTPEQQDEVIRVIHLHMQCCSPLAYLCPQQEGATDGSR